MIPTVARAVVRALSLSPSGKPNERPCNHSLALIDQSGLACSPITVARVTRVKMATMAVDAD